MRSSTTFQMLLHLGAYLAAAFAVMEIAIILYKIIGKCQLILSPFWDIHLRYTLVHNSYATALPTKLYRSSYTTGPPAYSDTG